MRQKCSQTLRFLSSGIVIVSFVYGFAVPMTWPVCAGAEGIAASSATQQSNPQQKPLGVLREGTALLTKGSATTTRKPHRLIRRPTPQTQATASIEAPAPTASTLSPTTSDGLPEMKSTSK